MCESKPCLNEGSCSAPVVKTNASDFQCSCKPGYTGKTCSGFDAGTSTNLTGWLALLLFCGVLAIIVLAYIGYYWREKVALDQSIHHSC